MNRRRFLAATGGFVAAASVSGFSTLADEPHATSRLIAPINRKWRFHPSRVNGAEFPDFDDSAFEPVTVPHANIRAPWHNFDDKDYEFVSTYRRRFRLPLQTAGKRVFVDFEGAMTASTVWINGISLGEYKGGYTPFSFELTPHLRQNADNLLAVFVDSTERADIPPFGFEIDYMTFGGIYREVSLRIVPETWIDNIFAHGVGVLSGSPSLAVDCFLAGRPIAEGEYVLEAELCNRDRVVARQSAPVIPDAVAGAAPAVDPATVAPVYGSAETKSDPARHTVSLTQLANITLWDVDHPYLYKVHVRLLRRGQVVDEDTRRVGFREATFTDQGFSLNGRILKLRGLDRHQTFPFAGAAMPARVQRQDAKILRRNLHCNIVRTSHYPQSRHFLDCCDDIGLLVLEEIPGWQHIGEEEWKLAAIDNVGRMVRRDWNHPSVVLWGVRINESPDDHDFYVRTNALAHALDESRQTGGIRNFADSEFIEDVFTVNDFGFPLRKPNHPRYLNTEFVGHTFPTKTTDDNERQREHTLRHARIHNQIASDPQYSGGIGWCAFDYNTHADFGSGDRICYHGVADIFREPKAAASFYKSQCEPGEEIVLEPAFHWAAGDESVRLTRAVVCSNCDHLKFFVRAGSVEANPWTLLADMDPDRAEFQYLKYPPFVLDLTLVHHEWGDLRIDGYIGGKQVISKSLSGRGVDRQFLVIPDDAALVADGSDATRVVLRVTDEFGAVRPYANDPILFTLEGPAELIGDNPFSLIGGTGAVWVRAKDQAGIVHLTAQHPRLGTRTVTFSITAATEEAV
ncbi:MAG TPA: glycoside hydrolase family 2 TIM barrel-domain containing protein [Acidobacteriaceae bacterium]|jgi:beta-galactosidase|nr:glycoside hydrolase family 2 TIM barrel-domain containing protein [Acidobacteriaceae bacterium]